MVTNREIFEKTFGFEPERGRLDGNKNWWDAEYRDPKTKRPKYSINLLVMEDIVRELKLKYIPEFIEEHFDRKDITPEVIIHIGYNQAALFVRFSDWNNGYRFDTRFSIFSDDTKEDTINHVMKCIIADYHMYEKWYSKLDPKDRIFLDGGVWNALEREEEE